VRQRLSDLEPMTELRQQLLAFAQIERLAELLIESERIAPSLLFVQPHVNLAGTGYRAKRYSSNR
jgi:hypothetical protein